MYRCRRLGRPASRITSCAWHGVCSERSLFCSSAHLCQRENVRTRMPHASTVDTLGSLLRALSSCTVSYSSTYGFEVFLLIFVCNLSQDRRRRWPSILWGDRTRPSQRHCSTLPESGEEWDLFHSFSCDDRKHSVPFRDISPPQCPSTCYTLLPAFKP